MTVFLYDIKRRLDLTLRESGGSINWNLPMDTTDFRIYKNVNNSIEFHVRNTDRKSINVTGKDITITIYDHRTDKILLEKSMEIVNGEKGLIRFSTIPDELDLWEIGSYSYVIRIKDDDGSERALYVDQNDGVRGYVTLDVGPYPPPRGATTILAEEMTTIREGTHPQDIFTYTSAIPGSIKSKNHTGLHTVVLHMDSFTGKVWIQGSLEEGSPGDDWFDIEIDGNSCLSYKRETGTEAISFTANLEWVRVRIFYDNEILSCDNNKITKIDFRN